MDIEMLLQKAVRALTDNGTFHITQLVYDKQHFGDVVFDLASEKLGVRFVRDRGDFWCQLKKTDNWIYIEEILEFHGMVHESFGAEFVGYVERVSQYIRTHLDRLVGQ